MTAVPYDAGQGGNPFDLLLVTRDEGEVLRCELHHRPDLVAPAAAAALAGRIAAVLRAAAREPALHLSELFDPAPDRRTVGPG